MAPFMASPSNKNLSTNSTVGGKGYPFCPTPNTTFIQTDPSNFKAVVHKYTGLRQETPPIPAGKFTSGEMGPRKPAFKLQERRQSARKLEITLNRGGFGGERVIPSPLSPLELFGVASGESTRSGTPTPVSTKSAPAPAPAPPLMVDEEMQRILENGFYRTPRGSKPPPPLLSLFPVHAGGDVTDANGGGGGGDSSSS